MSAPTMPQTMLPGMPRRLFACTPSRLAAFDCPRRYRLAYLARPSPPRGRPWAHNTVGAGVHVALARWWSLPASARTPQSGARLVQRHWRDDGFCDAAQSTRWRELAASWVHRYLSEHLVVEAISSEPIGVERTVAATTEALALSGRVDRIDRRGDQLVVVDYKTGRRGSTVDEARSSPALAMYVVAVRRTLRAACSRVELHHLPSGSIAGFEHTEQSLQRHLGRAAATAEDIVAATDILAAGGDPDEAFPPTPGPSCSWCDFRAHCPEGSAAAPAADPWAALDPDV